MKQIRIGNKTIGQENPVYIIAEIGINHEGSPDSCLEMIDAAILAGADAVKLQTIDAEASYTKNTVSYRLFKQAELSWSATRDIFKYAKQKNVDIFTTSADKKTIDLIETLEPAAYKISSGLMNHYPLIKYIAAKKRPIIISTGMSDIKQISEVVAIIENTGNRDISILQCTSLYPCPLQALNLANIPWFKTRFDYPIGFSDHSSGTGAAALAVAAGACVVEKHFTLDSNRNGYDHKLSLQPDEFKIMVNVIREAEKAMGYCGKIPDDKIVEARNNYQRCIVARRGMKAGETIQLTDMAFKRTSPAIESLEPVQCTGLVGKVLANDVTEDQLITMEDISH